MTNYPPQPRRGFLASLLAAPLAAFGIGKSRTGKPEHLTGSYSVTVDEYESQYGKWVIVKHPKLKIESLADTEQQAMLCAYYVRAEDKQKRAFVRCFEETSDG